jgi:branched-chain amino acid transport system substrate-binding protein
VQLRTRSAAAGLIAVVLMGASLGACANAPDTASLSKTAAPGVSDSEIRVGTLSSQSGPLAADFGAIVPGVQAYFAYVNSQGGVWGRKLVIADNADDAGVPSNNVTQARVLVQQNKVFAIVGVATAFFTAAHYLASTGTPTFGYATQSDWAGPPNLFAAYGSYIEFVNSSYFVGNVAKRLGAKSVALLAYPVAQSQLSCQNAARILPRFGMPVTYTDFNVPFGGDMTSDVLRMKQAKVDFVLSCFDVNGNLQLARTIRQNGLGEVPQFWFDGYNQQTLDANQALMTKTYFLVQHVPFQAAQEFPGAFPGLENYLQWMRKTSPSNVTSEVAMEGWISAATFVAGLRIAGKHPTQAGVVKGINQLSAFTADGLMPPVDWRSAHTRDTPPSCTAYAATVPTGSGTLVFKTAYNRGTDVWTCYPLGGPKDLSVTSPPPKGSPGT